MQIIRGAPVEKEYADSSFEFTATCPAGTTLTGGGVEQTPINGGLVSGSYPSTDGHTWTVSILMVGTPGTYTFTPYAVCLPVG
ncbi:hypothetical protein ABZ401_04305 [Streptomyces sp. NPDC005892]|uniref:hypothetical protein n=1 Tax=Streptomyces sp. NPDC005892 TaxID=3155593 RepID=UPI0033D62532